MTDEYTEADIIIWWNDSATRYNKDRSRGDVFMLYWEQADEALRHDIELAYRLYLKGRK